VTEALELYSSFYRAPADWRALMDVLALVGNPQVAVLDELTTGLDPQARRDTWDLIEAVRDRGVTIVLVTHFMAEAERLCDRVAVIDRGKVVVVDTPAALAERVEAEQRIHSGPRCRWTTGCWPACRT
jgi:ABC-2 type transport system ATP-binding protein